MFTTFVEIYSDKGVFVGRDTFPLRPKNQSDFKKLVEEQFLEELNNGDYIRAVILFNTKGIEPILLFGNIENTNNQLSMFKGDKQ